MANELPNPISKKEKFLAKAAGMDVEIPKAITKEEMYLEAIAKGGGGGGDSYTKAETDALLNNKQDSVLGSWTAGQATIHSTPTSSDTVLQALQKIDNNQRLDENNISTLSEIVTGNFISIASGITVDGSCRKYGKNVELFCQIAGEAQNIISSTLTVGAFTNIGFWQGKNDGISFKTAIPIEYYDDGTKYGFMLAQLQYMQSSPWGRAAILTLNNISIPDTLTTEFLNIVFRGNYIAI